MRALVGRNCPLCPRYGGSAYKGLTVYSVCLCVCLSLSLCYMQIRHMPMGIVIYT